MGYYFEQRQSMFAAVGMQVQRSLSAVARRFVGANPPHPVTYRAYSRRGILQVGDYRYHADFTKFFPDAEDEQYVFAWARQWSDGPASLMYDLTCFGPTVIYLNGQEAFRSTIFTERYADAKHRITLSLQPGWNHFVIRAKKTGGGCGWIFGSWLGKHPYTMMMPTPEREGQEGWLFTEPMSQELEPLPGSGTSEGEAGITWLPEISWDRKQQKQGQLSRIYGAGQKGVFAIARTHAWFLRPGTSSYTLNGKHAGAISIYLNDQEIFTSKTASGKIGVRFDAPFGEQEIWVKSTCPAGDWGFDLSIQSADGDVRLTSPCNLQGSDQPWIYIGPFAAGSEIPFDNLRDMHQVHETVNGTSYWRLDMPDAWVRMYNENALFGKWNYPLGVTLYGLLHAARAIGSPEIEQYIVDHMRLCADTFTYALWDRRHYGGATNVHNLLTSIDSLDDCGSFGSAFLEVAKDHEIAGYREIADYVADYITNKQDRQPDQTFYRLKMMHIFHENTMWADDLYMSVPFLCRYFKLTGERKYIDDAVRQFIGFKKRLFNPKLQIMSHVYDLRRDKPTGVPWGRANGWTIFSLSELLAALPDDHPGRPEMLKFFRELAAGYLALQDEQGMWHQVLTHPDSYPETSCTSMFTYAFARGVQYGWLEKPEPYIAAIFKAWEAINRISIDRGGNVFGVCRGSEFSFTPEYYKKELSWNLNDTHGVGIVLLAGVEVVRLKEFLSQQQATAKTPAKAVKKVSRTREKVK